MRPLMLLFVALLVHLAATRPMDEQLTAEQLTADFSGVQLCGAELLEPLKEQCPRFLPRLEHLRRHQRRRVRRRRGQLPQDVCCGGQVCNQLGQQCHMWMRLLTGRPGTTTPSATTSTPSYKENNKKNAENNVNKENNEKNAEKNIKKENNVKNKNKMAKKLLRKRLWLSVHITNLFRSISPNNILSDVAKWERKKTDPGSSMMQSWSPLQSSLASSSSHHVRRRGVRVNDALFPRNEGVVTNNTVNDVIGEQRYPYYHNQITSWR